MKTTNHTPGPWKVGNIKQSNRPDANFPIEAFYDAEGDRFSATVAEIPTWSFDGVTDANREEHIANANLIASAPDLLSALRFLLADYVAIEGETLTGSSVPVDMARAAISKAEGAK